MVSERKKKKMLLVFGGLLVGAICGLFGGGGGTLAVPLLEASGLDEKKSHATCIALVLPLCVITAIGYSTSMQTDYSSLWKVGLGVLIGGAVGATLLSKLPKKLISAAFYALMIYAGIRTTLK